MAAPDQTSEDGTYEVHDETGSYPVLDTEDYEDLLEWEARLEADEMYIEYASWEELGSYTPHKDHHQW